MEAQRGKVIHPELHSQGAVLQEEVNPDPAHGPSFHIIVCSSCVKHANEYLTIRLWRTQSGPDTVLCSALKDEQPV